MIGRYVGRKLLNHQALASWAASVGMPALDPNLHVTVAHSAVDFPHVPDADVTLAKVTGIKILGKDNAVVLCLEAPALEARWMTLRAAGAQWDFPTYQPHCTLYYRGAEGSSELPADMPLPPFALAFDGEVTGELGTDVFTGTLMKTYGSVLTKVDDEQRMAWGWASVSTMKDIPLIDLQGDMISTDDLQKAAHDFMCNSRAGHELHMPNRGVVATVVESLVFTKELQQALGIDLGLEGWFIGMHVTDDLTWTMVKRGFLGAFSIGGSGLRQSEPSANRT